MLIISGARKEEVGKGRVEERREEEEEEGKRKKGEGKEKKRGERKGGEGKGKRRGEKEREERGRKKKAFTISQQVGPQLPQAACHRHMAAAQLFWRGPLGGSKRSCAAAMCPMAKKARRLKMGFVFWPLTTKAKGKKKSSEI